jgi:LysM repeat protein
MWKTGAWAFGAINVLRGTALALGLLTAACDVPKASATTRSALTATAAQTSATPTLTQGSYVVQAGDSWWKIATDHSTTLQALLDVNQATASTVLAPGQVISLPGGTVTLARPSVVVPGADVRAALAPAPQQGALVSDYASTGYGHGAKTVHVRGYTKKNGTYVQSHTRSAPHHR